MSIRSVRAAAIAGALTFVLSIGLASPATAAPLAYPTWEEIEAARGNEAATSATIAAIGAALDDLQAQAATLGDAAVARQAEADTAQTAFERASVAATSLSTTATEAATRAEESSLQAGQIAAALYRSGGADLTGTLLLVSEDESSGLLYRLGALDKLGVQLDEVLGRAEEDRNLASSLAAQAEIAKKERERLSADAQTALTAAQAASAAADAAVAEQQQRLTVLYQQLASLKNTTVELEQQYRIGQSSGSGGGPGAGGSGSGGSGSGGSGGGSGEFTVPGNEVNNAAAAQAFAFAQSSARGWGSEQHYCLLLLWNRESGWRTNAYNDSSGAYGIPQSLPGSKMGNYAADWRTNYETQVMWGLLYISGRYDNPCGAWAHSESVGWY